MLDQEVTRHRSTLAVDGSADPSRANLLDRGIRPAAPSAPTGTGTLCRTGNPRLFALCDRAPFAVNGSADPPRAKLGRGIRPPIRTTSASNNMFLGSMISYRDWNPL